MEKNWGDTPSATLINLPIIGLYTDADLYVSNI